MNRPITGFHRDDEEHWVAELSCGHGRHVRHDPPFTERPWVQSPAEREARIGAALDCVRCDRFELPEEFEPYQRTPSFTESTLPEALRRDHATKPGVWGMIHVERGRLDYHVHAPAQRHEILTPASPGVVLPEITHHVAGSEPVAFYVEFWRRRNAGS